MGREDTLFIRLLGPTRCLREEQDLPLGAPRQQAVLAILASSAGHPVTMSALVEGLWGERPPASAEQSVYTYVAGLRQALEPERGRRMRSKLLLAVPGGYLLKIGPAQVDSLVFAGLRDEARGLRGERAIEVYERAFGLWHGSALSGLPGPFAEAERSRLEDLRVDAQEDHAHHLIQADRHEEALPLLQDLVRLHPLREPLRELLMVALARSGRQAEALESYREGRRILAEELGIDPSERLRRCHEDILRGSEAPADIALPVPRQLPRALLSFVGRAAETSQIKPLLSAPDDDPPVPLVAISGPPGVGKSALAAQLGHTVAEYFPDGQLYANLKGATDPVQPIDAMARFLRALGVPGGAGSGDLDELSALWRSTLNGRRMLICLDDVSGAAQIRPFLGASAGNSVLATSRESVTSLDDCVQIHLGRMDDVEGVTMVTTLVGAARVTAHREAAERLVRRCDGLPLALRIASARLIDNPDWTVGDLVDRLEDERRRLHELEAGDLAVRTSFNDSWTALHTSRMPLDRLAARTLTTLGLLGVNDVTSMVVAALMDVSPSEAEQALERLARAHLVERGQPGRYYFHDLVRLYASELDPPDRSGSLIRALGYYAASSFRASTLWDPHRVQPQAPPVTAAPHPMETKEQAGDWLAAEEPNLYAAAAQALTDPDDRIALIGVAIAFSLHWPYQNACRSLDIIKLNEPVLRIAERLGDDRMALEAHCHIAGGMRFLLKYEETLAHLEAERELAVRLGDGFCEQRAYGNMASLHQTMERHEDALRCARAQQILAKRIGSAVGERYALYTAGTTYSSIGDHEQARDCLLEGLEMAEQAGDVFQEASMRAVIGGVYLDLGDLPLALHHLNLALEQGRTQYNSLTVARCLVHLTRAARLSGELERAMDRADEAVQHAYKMQSPHWQREAREEAAAVEEALRAVSETLGAGRSAR
ncbi:BTAD domain-containing putative transcriptional regulator [Nonomuraea sp. NPDC050556]|uniref:AfsR/SARP family transcriptional regulator n=1 Tax=Nonomuraea sp. NPDC050556 TaxID=3364369 RepID=UPI00378F2A91